MGRAPESWPRQPWRARGGEKARGAVGAAAAGSTLRVDSEGRSLRKQTRAAAALSEDGQQLGSLSHTVVPQKSLAVTS